jgi:hypothetical protein
MPPKWMYNIHLMAMLKTPVHIQIIHVQIEHVRIVHGDRNETKIFKKTHIFSLSLQLPPLKGKKRQSLYLPHREKKDYKKDEVVFLAMFPPKEKYVVISDVLVSLCSIQYKFVHMYISS